MVSQGVRFLNKSVTIKGLFLANTANARLVLQPSSQEVHGVAYTMHSLAILSFLYMIEGWCNI